MCPIHRKCQNNKLTVALYQMNITLLKMHFNLVYYIIKVRSDLKKISIT